MQYFFDDSSFFSSIATSPGTVLPVDIHPIIDDTNARHIFENQTFTLRCFAHIDIGVIIVIDWEFPNRNKSDTVSDSIPTLFGLLAVIVYNCKFTIFAPILVATNLKGAH